MLGFHFDGCVILFRGVAQKVLYIESISLNQELQCRVCVLVGRAHWKVDGNWCTGIMAR